MTKTRRQTRPTPFLATRTSLRIRPTAARLRTRLAAAGYTLVYDRLTTTVGTWSYTAVWRLAGHDLAPAWFGSLREVARWTNRYVQLPPAAAQLTFFDTAFDQQGHTDAHVSERRNRNHSFATG